MKNMFVLVGLAIFLVSFSFVLAEENVSQIVTLPGNTEVIVKTTEEIDADKVNVGDLVNLVVAEDVVVDGQVVIKAEAKSIGEVTFVQKAALELKPAKVTFKVVNVTSIDKQTLTTLGSYTAEGEPIKKFILGVFKEYAKGNNVIIPIDTIVKVLTASNASIEVPVESNTSDVVIQNQ